jgi:hypothetical protein
MRKYFLSLLSVAGIVGFGLTLMAGAASASTGGQLSGKPTGQPVVQPYGVNNPCGDSSKCQPTGQPQPAVYTPPKDKCPCTPAPPPVIKCPQGTIRQDDRCVPCRPPVVKCPQGTIREGDYCVPCRPVPVVYAPPVIKCPQGTVRQDGYCVPCRPVPVPVVYQPRPAPREVCTQRDIRLEIRLLQLQRHYHLTYAQRAELRKLERLCGTGQVWYLSS